MSDPVINILERYLEERRSESGARGGSHTVAAEAKILGISAGTWSQLRNGKPITSKVIAKIVEKLGHNNEARKELIRQELTAALNSSKAERAPVDALEEFDRFYQTGPDVKRLICFCYRDVPQSTDTGKYPGYIDRSADIIKSGPDCALFQPFGTVEKIKEKVKEALDSDDNEAIPAWQYLLGLATDVRKVFVKTKKIVEAADAAGAHRQKGQIVLYEASKVSSLAACDVNSRVFYSSELKSVQHENRVIQIHESRVVQLIRGRDKEYFLECTTEPAYQMAVAAQFYPVLQYWRSNGSLPLEGDLAAYYDDGEECPWTVWAGPETKTNRRRVAEGNLT